jgi:hypothetical protein
MGMEMDYSPILFFVGVVPGIFCWLRYGYKINRAMKALQRTSAKEGRPQWKMHGSTVISTLDQAYFYFCPKRIIRVEDSSKVKRIKAILISLGGLSFWLNTFFCAIVSFTGGLILIMAFFLITQNPYAV